ncbi:unnamed protein product [Bemisia tabaci]|uniref:Prefoldin subunit 5 n=1 Tax=Bemisia tabaci TaxID=7038 RepID=A0A9P0ADN1_BEMTA|nr:PREDICTED: prefoldin subunit 5 [Bemisia tabaci]CAH0389493.1 unnamed protein product [Bemisia tabaci]
MSSSSTAASKSTPAPPETIDISKIPIKHLNALKQDLDKELNVFQDSLQTLKIAQTKFQESKESLEAITPDSKGKEILVPLTKSVYVPGRISDVDNVLLDIGTGYYIQKDIEGAKDYFQRKVEFVTKNMEKIQEIGLEKSRLRDAIFDAMGAKIKAEEASQAKT